MQTFPVLVLLFLVAEWKTNDAKHQKVRNLIPSLESSY